MEMHERFGVTLREYWGIQDAMRDRVEYSELQLDAVLDSYETPTPDLYGEVIDSEMTVGLMELFNAMTTPGDNPTID